MDAETASHMLRCRMCGKRDTRVTGTSNVKCNECHHKMIITGASMLKEVRGINWITKGT